MVGCHSVRAVTLNERFSTQVSGGTHQLTGLEKRCNPHHHRISRRTISGLVNWAEQVVCGPALTASLQIHSEEKYIDDYEAIHGTSNDNHNLWF